jgi:RNA polymerase sigma-70 factor (ECF subfamily)
LTITFGFSESRLNSAVMTDNVAPLDAEAKRIQFEQQAIPFTAYLYSVALNKTKGNYYDAEDLVQETFIKAYKAWHQFQQGTELKYWLSTILQNTFINKYNKKKKDKAYDGLDELEDFQLGEAESIGAVKELSAELAALKNLSSREVNEAMKHPSMEQLRDVVFMAIVQEMSYSDIAEELEIPIGTVMSRLHRGKAKLKNLLADYARAEGYKVEGKN